MEKLRQLTGLLALCPLHFPLRRCRKPLVGGDGGLGKRRVHGGVRRGPRLQPGSSHQGAAGVTEQRGSCHGHFAAILMMLGGGKGRCP
jgi:hypothetical protein